MTNPSDLENEFEDDLSTLPPLSEETARKLRLVARHFRERCSWSPYDMRMLRKYGNEYWEMLAASCINLKVEPFPDELTEPPAIQFR